MLNGEFWPSLACVIVWYAVLFWPVMRCVRALHLDD